MNGARRRHRARRLPAARAGHERGRSATLFKQHGRMMFSVNVDSGAVRQYDATTLLPSPLQVVYPDIDLNLCVMAMNVGVADPNQETFVDFARRCHSQLAERALSPMVLVSACCEHLRDFELERLATVIPGYTIDVALQTALDTITEGWLLVSNIPATPLPEAP